MKEENQNTSTPIGGETADQAAERILRNYTKRFIWEDDGRSFLLDNPDSNVVISAMKDFANWQKAQQSNPLSGVEEMAEKPKQLSDLITSEFFDLMLKVIDWQRYIKYPLENLLESGYHSQNVGKELASKGVDDKSCLWFHKLIFACEGLVKETAFADLNKSRIELVCTKYRSTKPLPSIPGDLKAQFEAMVPRHQFPTDEDLSDIVELMFSAYNLSPKENDSEKDKALRYALIYLAESEPSSAKNELVEMINNALNK